MDKIKLEHGKLYLVRQVWAGGKACDGKKDIALYDGSINTLQFFGSDVGGRPFEFDILAQIELVEVVDDEEI